MFVWYFVVVSNESFVVNIEIIPRAWVWFDGLAVCLGGTEVAMAGRAQYDNINDRPCRLNSVYPSHLWM